MNKYRAIKCKLDGFTFDSKAEARRYAELKLLQRAGQISGLTLQPDFVLLEKFTDIHGTKHRAICYVADFSYIENGRTVVEDVKGISTQAFRIKEKLFRAKFPQLELRITK